MNRVILSSVVSLLLIGLLAVGYFYYTGYRENSSKPEIALPPDACFFISGNVRHLIEELNHLPFWKNADSSLTIGQLKKDMVLLMQNSQSSAEVADFIQSVNAIVSFHVTGNDKSDALYLLPVKPDMSIQALQKTFRGNNNSLSENRARVFGGVDLYEISFPENNKVFTFAISGGIFIGSFTSFLVEDAIRQQSSGKTFGGNKIFEKQYNSELNKKGVLLCINYAKLKNYFATLITNNSDYKLNELGKWASWSIQQLDINKSSVTAQGFYDLSDTTNILTSFSNCEPAKSNVTSVLPATTTAFQSLVFNNCSSWLPAYRSKMVDGDAVNASEIMLNKFEQKVKVPIRQKFVSLIANDITLAITANSTTGYEQNLIALFKLNNPQKATLTLKAFTILFDGKNKKIATENYKNHVIGFIPADGLLPSVFGNSFASFNKNFYTIHGNYLVMANRASTVRNYIEEIENKNILLSSTSFAPVSKNFNSPFHYALYINPSEALSVWQHVANTKGMVAAKQADYFKSLTAFSYVVSKNNGVLNCLSQLLTGEIVSKREAQQLWVYFSDTTIHSGPFNFDNDGNQFTLLQDAGGTLFCLDEGGNLQWRLPLDGLISGDINQVLSSETGALQFIFCTDKKIYLVDQFGKINNRYPLRLPASPVNGIYTHIQCPYFFIPCTNNQLYAYDFAGRPAAGWNLIRTSSPIRNVNVNAYSRCLYFMDDANTLYVYEMNGTLKMKVTIDPPANLSVCSTQDSIPAFVFCDSTGTVTTLKNDYTTSTQNLPTQQKVIDYLFSDVNGDNVPEHVILQLHEITIYDSKLSLIGNCKISDLFKPVIKTAKRNNKNYISVSSVNDSLYVFNGKAELLNGFPVAAASYSIKAGNKMVTVTSRDKNDKIKSIGFKE